MSGVFPGPDELALQIAKDVDSAKKVLAEMKIGRPE